MRQLLFVTLISCTDIQGARELATTAEQFRALADAVEPQRGAADFPDHPIESTSAEQSTPAESSDASLPVDMADEPLETLQRALKEEPVLDRASATEPDSFELSATLSI